jgi:hypothetical protein
MARLIEVGLFVFCIVLIFLVARKAWRQADIKQSVKDKLDQFETESEVVEQVAKVKKSQVTRNRKKISEFGKL